MLKFRFVIALGLISLCTIAPVNELHGATNDAPVERNCRRNGTLTICVLRAALSIDDRSGTSLQLHATLSIEITNNGELPIELFAPNASAAFMPDKGPEIAGIPQITGMPTCPYPPQNCLANKAFVPIRLAPDSSANININISQRQARENVAHMALATTAIFSGEIYLVDGDQHLSGLSISLPVLALDNGLAGT